VVQVSGGEPLLRDDVWKLSAHQGRSKLPYTILVSNWSLMTEEKYLALREAGIHSFRSAWIRRPAARRFPRLSGLYRHLEDLIRASRSWGTTTSCSTVASPART